MQLLRLSKGAGSGEKDDAKHTETVGNVIRWLDGWMDGWSTTTMTVCQTFKKSKQFTVQFSLVRARVARKKGIGCVDGWDE